MLGGSQEPLTATSPRSLGQSNNALRLNPAFADVVLLVGETQKEVYAHAAILAQNCEYYNRALADRWTSTDTTPLGNKTFRAVLTHPDVTVDVLNIVLEFIYTGTTKVPDEHITSVCLFADQLVLPLLVDQCIKHYTDYLLCPNNAFDFYVLCHKLSRDGAKGAAILTVLDGFNEAIQHGGHAILELGDDELRRVLMFHMLTPEQRWRIVIAWVKLRQGVEDVALEHGLGDDFNLEHGREDVKDLIPFVGLFTFTKDNYTAYVVPYLDILEDGLVALLKGHFVPLVIQGNETWGADLLPNSAILNRSSFQTLCNLVNSNIKLITPTETKLLFRASEHGFSNAKFHQQCDGKGDLFVLIKTAGGRVIGAYSDAPWHSLGQWIPVKEAFLFSFTGGRMHMMPCNNKSYGIYGSGALGATYGSGHDLCINGKYVTSRIDLSYTAFGKTSEQFLGSAVKVGSNISTEVVEYEVYELVGAAVKGPLVQKESSPVPIQSRLNAWDDLDDD